MKLKRKVINYKKKHRENIRLILIFIGFCMLGLLSIPFGLALELLQRKMFQLIVHTEIYSGGAVVFMGAYLMLLVFSPIAFLLFYLKRKKALFVYIVIIVVAAIILYGFFEVTLFDGKQLTIRHLGSNRTIDIGNVGSVTIREYYSTGSGQGGGGCKWDKDLIMKDGSVVSIGFGFDEGDGFIKDMKNRYPEIPVTCHLEKGICEVDNSLKRYKPCDVYLYQD